MLSEAEFRGHVSVWRKFVAKSLIGLHKVSPSSYIHAYTYIYIYIYIFVFILYICADIKTLIVLFFFGIYWCLVSYYVIDASQGIFSIEWQVK